MTTALREVAYLGLDLADPAAMDAFLADVVGLVPGERTIDEPWTDDRRYDRIRE